MKYSNIPLRDLLKQVNRREEVLPYKRYKMIGAKWYAKGLYIKSAKDGSDIKAKHLYLLRSGDFVYNRLFAWKGSFAIVPKELDGCYVSNEYPTFRIDERKILPSYLMYYFSRLEAWDRAFSLSKGVSSISRNRLKVRRFLSIEIPLPNLEKQRRIAARIEAVSERAEEAEKMRYEIMKEMEMLTSAIRSKVFNRSNPIGPVIPIGDSELLLNNETINPRVKCPNDDFLYLDISAIEAGTGRIKEIKKYKGYEAPSRARRLIKTGDVLVSTVRPYLKSFAIVPQTLNNQVCSTGFAVFTCPPSVEPLFLLHQFFSDFFIEQCIEKMKGAHYPAIGVTKLRECELMIPSIENQYRVISYLSPIQKRVEELMRLQNQITSETKDLVPSILDKAFKGEW